MSNDKIKAWLVPSLLTFEGVKKVHFSRAPGGEHLTDDQLKALLEGTVTYNAETVFFNDGGPVVDKDGVTHPPVPLMEYDEEREGLIARVVAEYLGTEIVDPDPDCKTCEGSGYYRPDHLHPNDRDEQCRCYSERIKKADESLLDAVKNLMKKEVGL